MKRETTMILAGDPSTRRRMHWVMVGMLMTLLSAIGVTAWAQSPPPPPPGMDGRPGMMFRGSPERIGKMVDFMLDGLHATDAQRTQIKQIAVQVAADVKAQFANGQSLRQRSLQIFTAPTIDAAAAEQVRQQQLQQHDQMSRRVTQALLDVAKVLTPEQRAMVGQRIRDRQARMEDRKQRMQHDAPR